MLKQNNANSSVPQHAITAVSSFQSYHLFSKRPDSFKMLKNVK